MSDKKPLKLGIKKKESSPITAAPKAQASTAPEAQASIIEHIPQTEGIKLILKNAKIHIDQVIIRKK